MEEKGNQRERELIDPRFFRFLCKPLFVLLLIRYPDKITEAGLLAFEKKFFDGELVPSLKSEEPADEDLAEPVKVLKGKSFSKLVLENGEA